MIKFSHLPILCSVVLLFCSFAWASKIPVEVDTGSRRALDSDPVAIEDLGTTCRLGERLYAVDLHQSQMCLSRGGVLGIGSHSGVPHVSEVQLNQTTVK